jgi:hypothetical protein
MKNSYTIFVEKLVGNRQLGRPRRKWKDIKIELVDISVNIWAGFNWLRKQLL